MSGDARAALAILRQQADGTGDVVLDPAEARALLAEHARLSLFAVDPVAVVAGVDLEGVLAGHRLDTSRGDCTCGFVTPNEGWARALAAHQAAEVRKVVKAALNQEPS